MRNALEIGYNSKMIVPKNEIFKTFRNFSCNASLSLACGEVMVMLWIMHRPKGLT